MLNHQTKDILYILNFLDYKKFDITPLCIRIEQALFKETDDEIVVMAVKTPEEIKSLSEEALNTSVKKMTCSSSENVNKQR